MGKLRLAFPHVLQHLRAFRQRRRRKASSASSACEDHANSGISCRGCTSPARVHPAASASRSSPSRDHHKAIRVKSSRSARIRWLHPSAPSSEKARSLNRPALFRKKRARIRSAGSKVRGIAAQRNRGLLLVCNPCTNSSAGMVTEEYKFKIGGIRRGHDQPTSTTALGRDDWQKEKSWNIVTQMGDDLVTKRVVLKRRKKKKTKNRFSCESCDGAPAAAAVAAQPAAFYEDDRLESSCSSSAGCKYRLSTSSADACCWESGGFAWDREPSFASGDDCFDEPLGSKTEDCFVMLDRLEASVKEVFVDPACSSRGTTAEKSNVEMMNSPLLGDSFQSFEHYIRSLQQLAAEKHFPSPARSAAWDLDEADDEGGFVDPIVKNKEEKKFITNKCTKLAEGSGGLCERSVKRAQRKAASRPNASSSSSSRSSNSRKSSSKKKSSGPLVGGGVAVVKVSVDPYRDYRDSMVEMMVANGLDQASDVEVEELLQCYLSLNPPEFHDTIINVFSELWFRLVHKQKLN